MRYALAAKNIAYEPIAVNLLNGESESPEHLARSPAGFVPVLEIQGELQTASPPICLTESLAIIQYLDEVHADLKPQLIPVKFLDRARVWALAEIINAGTQPLQNVPVFQKHSQDPAEQKSWNQHWIRQGLEVFEKVAAPHAGSHSFGDQLTLADLCLMPQLYNADRFEVPYQDLPTLVRVSKNLVHTKPYQDSHPDRFHSA